MARQLTPAEMVQARAIAPYEIEALVRDWSQDALAWGNDHGLTPEQQRDAVMLEMHDGAGPPWPCEGETHREYGLRMAVALFTLIKEI